MATNTQQTQPAPVADILIVGYGGAGATAALRAAELGAEVVILEKQPSDFHTPSTRMSGGLVMAVNDVEKAARYLTRCAGGMVSADICRVWAERASELLGWLRSQSDALVFQRVGGAEHVFRHRRRGIDPHGE